MPTESNATNFLNTLIALRDRYLVHATTSDQQASYAREQLNHINALLVDQMIAPESSAMAIAPSPDFPVLLGASLPAVTPDKSIPAVKAQPKQPKPTAASKRQIKAAPESKPSTTPAGKQETTQRDTVLPLLPPFAGLSKTQAVAKLMADQAGQVLSLDQIIEQLHGELDESALRQERKRMRTILWRGVDSKRWEKVKGKDSHYTLPTKLLPASHGKATGKPKSAATTTKTARETKAATNTVKTRKAATAKPAIAGSLMGSVEKVLQDNRGTPMRAEAIATALFGELSPARLAAVKKDVSDRLAKGAKAQRWQRVPKQLGVYVYP
jgi:hypothetical protein